MRKMKMDELQRFVETTINRLSKELCDYRKEIEPLRIELRIRQNTRMEAKSPARDFVQLVLEDVVRTCFDCASTDQLCDRHKIIPVEAMKEHAEDLQRQLWERVQQLEEEIYTLEDRLSNLHDKIETLGDELDEARSTTP